MSNAGFASEVVKSSGITVDVLLNLGYACSDRIKDGDEVDVDCGGSCTSKCANGKSCIGDADCKSDYCVSGSCKAGSCTDKIKNGDESGTDCGGSCIKKCDLGVSCSRPSDCSSGVCKTSVCVAEGPCSNKAKDSGETDIDCGGICASAKAKKCAIGANCISNSDCTSSLCSLARCVGINDRDNDGISNSIDLCPDTPSEFLNGNQADFDGDKQGNECDPDDDNDGMPDDWEKMYLLDPFYSRDSLLDTDRDGLKNVDEFSLGTSPRKSDTDNDGANDGKEVLAGTDPKDAKSKPKGGFIFKAGIFLLILAGIVGAGAFAASFARKRSSQKGMNHAKHVSVPRKQEALPMPREPERPEFRQHRYHSRHDVFNELEKTYSKLSGEELFKELRKRTERR